MQHEALTNSYEELYRVEREKRLAYETALTAILNHDCGCDPKAPWCDCAAELRDAARDALNGKPITLGVYLTNETDFSEVK